MRKGLCIISLVLLLLCGCKFHAPTSDEQNKNLFENSESDSFFAPLYYHSLEKKFEFENPHKINPEMIRRARVLYGVLVQAIERGDTQQMKMAAFEMNLILKYLGITDLKAPTNVMMIKIFKENLEARLGKVAESQKNIFFPFYYYTNSDNEKYFSVLYPFSEFKNRVNPNFTLPEIPSKIGPYGKKWAVKEYDLKQILILYLQEKLVYRRWKVESDRELLIGLLKSLIKYQHALYYKDVVELPKMRKFNETPEFVADRKLAQELLHKFNPEAVLPQNSKDCTKLIEQIIAENSVDITQKSYHLFPLFSVSESVEKFNLELLLLFRYRKTMEFKEWSFLWRVFNLKVRENGNSGYFFFIPFGEK